MLITTRVIPNRPSSKWARTTKRGINGDKTGERLVQRAKRLLA